MGNSRLKNTEKNSFEVIHREDNLTGVLDAVMAAMPDALVIYNKDGKPVYINETAEKIFASYHSHAGKTYLERSGIIRVYTVDGKPLSL